MTPSAAVHAHRLLYRSELAIKPTARNVPADTEPIRLHALDGDEWVPTGAEEEVTDSGPLGGAPLSPAMNRRLSEPPIGENLWASSLFYLKHACRKDHPGHTEREPFRGSLCWRVVYLVICSELDPTQAADELGIPTESVLRHLNSALRWITEDMDRKARIRNARDPKPSEEPTPTRLSLLVCDAAQRAVADFDLEQRIWAGQVGLMRRDLGDAEEVLELVNDPTPHYVKITRQQWEQKWSWEAEWARRQALLMEHQAECDRCRRAA